MERIYLSEKKFSAKKDNPDKVIENEITCYNNYVKESKHGDFYHTQFVVTYTIWTALSAQYQLGITLELNKQLHKLEEILYDSTTNGLPINIIYMDSPSRSDAAMYAHAMNMSIE